MVAKWGRGYGGKQGTGSHAERCLSRCLSPCSSKRLVWPVHGSPPTSASHSASLSIPSADDPEHGSRAVPDAPAGLSDTRCSSPFCTSSLRGGERQASIAVRKQKRKRCLHVGHQSRGDQDPSCRVLQHNVIGGSSCWRGGL